MTETTVENTEKKKENKEGLSRRSIRFWVDSHLSVTQQFRISALGAVYHRAVLWSYTPLCAAPSSGGKGRIQERHPVMRCAIIYRLVSHLLSINDRSHTARACSPTGTLLTLTVAMLVLYLTTAFKHTHTHTQTHLRPTTEQTLSCWYYWWQVTPQARFTFFKTWQQIIHLTPFMELNGLLSCS
jgi:hypothetical protein